MNAAGHKREAEKLAGLHGEWYFADREDVPAILRRAQVHATLATIPDPDPAVSGETAPLAVAYTEALTVATTVTIIWDKHGTGEYHATVWRGPATFTAIGDSPAEALTEATRQLTEWLKAGTQ